MPPLSLGSVRMPALRGGSGLGMAPGVRRGGSAGGGRAVPFDLGGRRALRQAVLSRIVLGPPRGLEPAGA
jgi:hypothetical protein